MPRFKREGSSDVTVLLERIREGDDEAADLLFPLVYEELRVLAQSRMARERVGNTLQPTALVHEAYIRLVGDRNTDWKNRAHFFAAAAEAIRRILIERARRKRRIRHGGNHQRQSFEEVAHHIESPGAHRGEEMIDLLALDEALQGLEKRDQRKADIVKLRFFAGLSIEETANALGVNARTVNRDWVAAKAWIRRAVGEDQSSRRPSPPGA